MDQLWAPWRLSYVAKPAAPKTGDDCFICAGLAADADRENLIALRTPHAVVVLNRFPYNNGHLLVAPRHHVAELDAIAPDAMLDLMATLTRMVGILRETMRPEGFNIGLNLGRVAGAGLPGHLHWHIVPRWNGDTNFMTVTGDTRVINQSLDALWDLLARKLQG